MRKLTTLLDPEPSPFLNRHLAAHARHEAWAAPSSAPCWETDESPESLNALWGATRPELDESALAWLYRFATALSGHLALDLKPLTEPKAPNAWSQAWAAGAIGWSAGATFGDSELIGFSLGSLSSLSPVWTCGLGAGCDSKAFTQAWAYEVFPKSYHVSRLLHKRSSKNGLNDLHDASSPRYRPFDALLRVATSVYLACGFPHAAVRARSWTQRRSRLVHAQRGFALRACREALRLLGPKGETPQTELLAWAQISTVDLFGPVGHARALCAAALAWATPSTRAFATLVWFEGASLFAEELADENQEHHWTYDDPSGVASHFGLERLLWLLPEAPRSLPPPTWGRACLQQAISNPHFKMSLNFTKVLVYKYLRRVIDASLFRLLCDAALGAQLDAHADFIENAPKEVASLFFYNATLQAEFYAGSWTGGWYVGDRTNPAHMLFARALGRNLAWRNTLSLAQGSPVIEFKHKYDPALEVAFTQGQIEKFLPVAAEPPKRRSARL